MNEHTIKRAVCLFSLLPLLIISSGCVPLDKAAKHYQQLQVDSPLNGTTVAAGLKEALRIGSERAAQTTSAVDGYLGNTLIRLTIPDDFQTMTRTLRKVGLGHHVDEMEIAMNRAAEQAASEAREVFWQAISSMTLDDAMAILKGHESAATEYFRTRTEQSLRARYQPIVLAKMEGVGLYQSYNRAVEYYMALPFAKRPALDLNQYVTDGALNGLFTMLAQEEKKIRTNPEARTTALLKKVFADQ
jgi:hypothetical protein